MSPAEIIADIYRHRRAIELFFRFFEHVLGCRPTLRSYEMVCLYLQGWADLDEVTEHLESLASRPAN